jgi:hypothetical protein
MMIVSLNTGQINNFCTTLSKHLEVFTNEKKDGVVSFDRSLFKLFTLTFSNKSVQAPSCETKPRPISRDIIL